MDELRIYGYCEHCGNEVTNQGDEYYISEDGRVFCRVECVCQHYSVTKVEV
jgi:hypothetical protein